MIVRGHQFSGASFSDDLRCRYSLWRAWDQDHLPTFAACMLNPSTADESKNDPTVERVERRARMLGFGKLIVVNLFAHRATDPKELEEVDDPIGGQENNKAIINAIDASQIALLGWGAHGLLLNRGLRVLHMLHARGLSKKCRYLKITRSSQPGHPLYVGYDVSLKEFK